MAMSDGDMEKLIANLLQIYNDMEMDLVKEVAKRFETYNEASGSLKWQAEKLDEIGVLNKGALKTISKYSDRAKEEIRRMLKKAQFANIDKEDWNNAWKDGALSLSLEQIKKQPAILRVLLAGYKDVIGNTVKLIETKALESVTQSYSRVVNQAYLETVTGTYGYNQAITRGIRAMADAGFYGATYVSERGRVTHMSIEAVVRRDALSACNRLANDTMWTAAKEAGNKYVEVTSHIGSRTGDGEHNHTNHAWWQGRIYALEGEGTPDDDDAVGYHIENLVAVTGYGLVDGLGGVNCRHRMIPFIPGISMPVAEHYDEEENKRIYDLTQKQRSMERNIRKWKKRREAFRNIGTDEGKAEFQKAKTKVKELSKELIDFTKENGLERQGTREQILEKR